MKNKRRFLKFGAPILALALIVAACGGADPTATSVPATATPRPTATTAAMAMTPTAMAEPTATTAAMAMTPTAMAQPTATTAAMAMTPTAMAQPTATRAPVPTATPTPVPPTPTPVEDLPVRGGTIRSYLGQDIPTLDPTKIEAYQIFFSLDEIWSNLVQYKSDFYTQVEFTGDLADRWEVSDSGDLYTFFLNPNARWQNLPPLNGRPVTADDVKWTFELYADKEYASQMIARVNFVESITAIDDKTVQIKLNAPANNVLYDFAWVTTKIHARELMEQGLLGSKEGVVGSGAMVFDVIETGSLVKSVRSNNYWRDGIDGDPLPYVDSYEIPIIGDAQTHVAALRAGQLAFAGVTGLSALAVAPLEGVEGLILEGAHPMFIRILGINNERPPLDNINVRKAVLMATDIRSLMRNANKFPDMPLESFNYSISGDLSLPQERLAEIQKFDLDGAKALLAQEGYADGFDIGILNIFGGSPAGEVLALTGQMWTDLGLNVTLETGPRSETTARRAASDFDTCVCTLNLQADPVAQLNAQFRTGVARNYYKIDLPEANALIDKAKSTFDRAELQQILHQAQEILWENAASIPISPGFNFQATWDWVKNYKNNFAWGNQGIKFAWIDRS